MATYVDKRNYDDRILTYSDLNGLRIYLESKIGTALNTIAYNKYKLDDNNSGFILKRIESYENEVKYCEKIISKIDNSLSIQFNIDR